MENHIVHKFSRLFPSSFTSCQFRNIPDVVENSFIISKNSKFLHNNNVVGASSRTHSSIKTQESKTKNNTMKFSKGSKTHRSNKESNLVKSCSSNSGWFSSEGENGETEDAIFSLSSGYFSESFRRKPADICRKKYNQKSWETSRCSSELSANSVSTALSENRANGRAESNLNESKWVKSVNGLDFAASRTEQNRGKVSRSARKTAGTYRKKYNQASSVMSRSSSELSLNSISTTLIEEKTNKRVGSNLNELKQLKSINDYYFATSKTEQNRTTTSKTARRTAEKQTRSGGRTHRKIIPVEKFDYYNECTSDTRRRTTKSHRKIKKLRSINSDEMGKFTIVVDGRIEESIAVEKNTSDPYSDFRTSMLEMIVEKQIFGIKDLQRLLHCFLSLNSPSFHNIIFEVFSEICETFFN